MAKIRLKTKQVKPHQLAWLRRSELDTKGIEVWELPCGLLYPHEAGTPLTILLQEEDKDV